MSEKHDPQGWIKTGALGAAGVGAAVLGGVALIDTVPIEIWRAIQTGGSSAAVVLLFLYLRQLRENSRLTDALVKVMDEQTSARINDVHRWMAKIDGHLARIDNIVASFLRVSGAAAKLADRLEEEVAKVRKQLQSEIGGKDKGPEEHP